MGLKERIEIEIEIIEKFVTTAERKRLDGDLN